MTRTAASMLREKRAAKEEIENRGGLLESGFIAQLDRYYGSPGSGFHDSKIAKRFYEQKLRHLAWKPYPNDGLVTFGASGTNKCDLEVFFRNQKLRPKKSDDLSFRGRQRRNGSAIVDFLQIDLAHMLQKPEVDYPFRLGVMESGEYEFEDAAQLRKVFEYDGVKFAITAKPDGVLYYKGERLLFEYKTKASGLKVMHSKLDFSGADRDHLRQVTAESLLFGTREGLILYESTQKPSWYSDEERKSVSKGQKTWKDGEPIPDMRAFYFNITDSMQEQLLSQLAAQAHLVYEGVKPDVTADDVQKCGFCPYFGGHCQGSLSAENIAELQQIESRMSSSLMAGKQEHTKLIDYLEGVSVSD